MSGNVWEWCSDWYSDYISGTATNPVGSVFGSDRVFRGGSWGGNAENCRAANRYYGTPTGAAINLGIRVVFDVE